MGLKSKKRKKVSVCGECEQSRPIRCYCSDCQNYLCEECGLQLHKRLKAYRGHKVIPVEEINAATLQSCQTHYCPMHKSEALRLYCKSCSKLICRDCTLVEHRQHDYTFVEEARKQVKAEMATLKVDVIKKLSQFKSNLHEIEKVEVSATGHSEVLKADINAFFDKLMWSIEERRKALLHQAEADCQKDVKQVWVEKSFHEVIIAHISSVFGLVDKAERCTSDSEMVLTALHGITQLKKLKETEWDSLAFTKMVLSTPKFTEGERVEVNTVGKLSANYDKTQSSDIHLINLFNRGTVGATVSFNVNVNVTSSLTQHLIDGRSGTPVRLKFLTPPDLTVVIHYGHSVKELNSASITIEKVSECQKKVLANAMPIKRKFSKYPVGSSQATCQSKLQDQDCMYNVSIRLLCGGRHTLTLRVGGSEVTHTFNVVGQPAYGTRVRKGPDWNPQRTDCDQGLRQSNEIGTISSYRHHGSSYNNDVYFVDVSEDSGATHQYKWGIDEKYEIELV